MLTDCSIFSTLNSPAWESAGEMHFYYSEMLFMGIPVNSISNLSVFPNPAKNSVSFSWLAKYPILQLELYNARGNLMMKQCIENNTDISLDHLEKGLYLYKLTNNNKLIYSQKLMIE